jgi:hypothetical protein
MAHPITDALAGMTAAERAAYKAAAMGVLADMIGATVDRGAFRITITDLDYFAGPDALRIRIRVNRIANGNNVTPPGVNPIIVINPPILVDDVAGDIVRTWTDRQGVAHTRTLREDLRAAMREVIRDAVKDALT